MSFDELRSQADVVAYLREAAIDCRGASEGARRRGSIIDAEYLAGRADAFSLASALIEGLPSFKGEKTGASAPSPEAGKKNYRGGGRRKRDPAADEARRVLAAELTAKTRENIQKALTGDPDA